MTKTKEDLFAIDPGELPEEWIAQPTLYLKWANAAADEREERDRCKANMELVEAELSSAIRRRPAKYKLDKLTEGAIGELVKANPKYQDAQAAYLEAKATADYADVAVQALEHRKRALEKLVDLVLAGDLSVPRNPKGENGEHLEELKKRKARRVV